MSGKDCKTLHDSTHACPHELHVLEFFLYEADQTAHGHNDSRTHMYKFVDAANSCMYRALQVNFLGPRSEFVVSGSDCGHIFIWDAKTGELVNLLKVCDVLYQSLFVTEIANSCDRRSDCLEIVRSMSEWSVHLDIKRPVTKSAW